MGTEAVVGESLGSRVFCKAESAWKRVKSTEIAVEA